MTTKKIVIITALSLFIAAFFTATQPIRPEMAIVSSIFVVLFALPSYWAVVHAKGWKRGLLLLGALGFYALLIESSAIHTGFPYGDFIYNDLLGQKVFGLTPWTVAFAWPPILLLTYWFARKRHGEKEKFKIWFSTAFDAMLIDLVLDPAAVNLGFWNWREPGFYYGVPVVNFLGWLLSCFIGAILLHYLWGTKKVPIGLAYSGIAILWFWTIANVFMLQIIPAVVGLLLLGLLFKNVKHAHTI
jgi:bisanhydrobacterioruberin hydratase